MYSDSVDMMSWKSKILGMETDQWLPGSGGWGQGLTPKRLKGDLGSGCTTLYLDFGGRDMTIWVGQGSQNCTQKG